MDDLERRLTEALHAEADSVTPHGRSWDGHRPASGQGSVTWLAVAAAVAVLVVGVTFAVRAGRTSEATAPSVVGTTAAAVFGTTAAKSSTADACDGGWTSFGTTVITAGPNPVDLGTTAILRFAGGTPDAATLCAVIAGPDHQTLASGSAHFGGSKLGYLSMISGQQTYFVGAFAGTVKSVTFQPGQAPGSRGESGPVTITATTPGVTDLDHGWRAYAVLAPRTASATVDVTATAPDGTVLGSEKFSTTKETTSSASSRAPSNAPRETSSSASSTNSSTGDGPSLPRCGGQLAAALPGISATLIPQQPDGGWQFRLTNGTTLPLTVETLHGYAQLIASNEGVVQSVSSDPSYVLRKAITLKKGESTVFATVGLDTSLCGGGRVPTGDHTIHLVMSGVFAGRNVVFTAASFVVHFPTSGSPVLVR